MLRIGVMYCAIASVLLAPPARAGTAEASISVSVSIIAACSVSGGTVSFGALQPGAAAAQQGALAVNCTSGAPYSISLGEGQSGDGSTRRMSGPAGATIAYDLYRDAGHSQRWATGGAAQSGAGTGSEQAIAVYAAMAAAGSVPGGYADTVTATLTY